MIQDDFAYLRRRLERDFAKAIVVKIEDAYEAALTRCCFLAKSRATARFVAMVAILMGSLGWAVALWLMYKT